MEEGGDMKQRRENEAQAGQKREGPVKRFQSTVTS
jgi:hypothetical protein